MAKANQFAGTCAKCRKVVPAGEGTVRRRRGRGRRWEVLCSNCGDGAPGRRSEEARRIQAAEQAWERAAEEAAYCRQDFGAAYHYDNRR